MVSRAGTAPLRALATGTGLAGAVAGVLLDTYPGFPVHAPRQIFAGPAVAIADGADAVAAGLAGAEGRAPAITKARLHADAGRGRAGGCDCRGEPGSG